MVSHTVLSRTGNMGKTLLGYLADFSPQEVAQFYIHSEVPTDNSVCMDYYRFTDVDAVKSVFFRHEGTRFNAENIELKSSTTRRDVGTLGEIYQFGRKRSGNIYLMRNLLWKLAHWKTQDLKNWLREVAPDVILFASGDYAFMYDIAYWMANFLHVPLVVSCMDDYYLHNANEKSAIGRFQHKLYLKTVKKTMRYAEYILTICDSMKKEYEKLFSKTCYVLHTSAEQRKLRIDPDAQRISYIGNLGYNRNLQLVEIGNALRNFGRQVEVYSGERNEDTLATLKKDGICFHGSISAEEVLTVMGNSLAVIHTESFDPEIQNEIRFSVSTKIAESLMYGPCLIAYGPEGIASIDYLKENNAAYVISRPEDLEKGLEEILTNKELREQIVRNARALALKNHNADVNPRKVRKWLQEVVDKSQNESSTN